MISSSCATYSVKNSDRGGGGHGPGGFRSMLWKINFDISYGKIALFFIFKVQTMFFHCLDLNPSGGAGHERGSTHSVQSLLNLDNINNAQWDILTEYMSY